MMCMKSSKAVDLIYYNQGSEPNTRVWVVERHNHEYGFEGSH